MGERCVYQANGAHEVELKCLLPLLLVDIIEFAWRRATSVADQNIQAPKLAGRAVHDLANLVWFGDICLDGERLRTCCPHSGGSLVEGGEVTGEDGYVDAFSRQRCCAGAAQSLAGGSDNGRMPLDAKIHCWLLLLRTFV